MFQDVLGGFQGVQSAGVYLADSRGVLQRLKLKLKGIDGRAPPGVEPVA